MLRTTLLRSRATSSAFNPLSLFAAGEQGVWYDPSDLSTLFQDAAGTIPVTAAGQPVGMMRDKSGRGNHATQSTANSRPILQTESGKWYLAFDGLNDGMVTGSINFSVTNKLTTCAGVHKASESAAGFITMLGVTGSENGAFKMLAPSGQLENNLVISSKGTTEASAKQFPFPAPTTAVLVGQADIGAPLVSLKRNGGTAVSSTGTQGTGSYGNYPLFVGCMNGPAFSLNGKIFGLIVRGAASDATTVANLETWMNGKTGAY